MYMAPVGGTGGGGGVRRRDAGGGDGERDNDRSLLRCFVRHTPPMNSIDGERLPRFVTITSACWCEPRRP